MTPGLLESCFDSLRCGACGAGIDDDDDDDDEEKEDPSLFAASRRWCHVTPRGRRSRSSPAGGASCSHTFSAETV